MKQIIKLIFCVVALSLTCCLSSFQDSSSVQYTESFASSTQDSIAEYNNNNDGADVTNNETLIIVSMIVSLLLIIAAIGYMYKKYSDLQNSYDKLSNEIKKLQEKLQKTQLAPTNNDRKHATIDSIIESLDESYHSLDRRLQILEQNRQMATSYVAPTMMQPVAQTAKPVNHGYFKEPIKGQSGAYFEGLYSEKSGACFEVEHTGNTAAFSPIVKHSSLIENDRIIDYAVEYDGDLNNSHIYKCIKRGKAHLENGRWIIDSKAKVKLS